MGAIDEEGYVRLVDRTTNLIKSRGEWIISSVDLENAITAHPGVAEAAVIGIAHTKKTPLGRCGSQTWRSGDYGGVERLFERPGPGSRVDSR
jgi:acyl-CoA synthetase (AMP-forming)/AMP-acid ligase II